jgi:hypothetical protein
MMDRYRVVGVEGREVVYLGARQEELGCLLDVLDSDQFSRLLIDCPPYSCRLDEFKIMEKPVSWNQFKKFWNSDSRREVIKPSEEDLYFWDEVFQATEEQGDAPALGVTHAEASAFSMVEGGRLPWQHEIEVILRDHARGAVMEERPPEVWSPEFYEVLAMTPTLTGCVEERLIGPGVYGLYDYIDYLVYLKPGVQCEGLEAVRAIKCLSPNALFYFAGAYIVEPVWRHYVGTMRVRPFNPAGFWVVWD